MEIQEWLGKDNQAGFNIWTNKYQYNGENFEQWLERVSGGNPDVSRLIREKKFLFGGRVLASRGVDSKQSYSNCYVCKAPEDNLESIFNTCTQMARTYSYGGGCGVDISKLRPNGSNVNNAAKTSSGACSFMDLLSTVTETICQSGRRGALMISIACNHPDIEEFIHIKSNLERVQKANISIRFSDLFLESVENDRVYRLHFKNDKCTIKKDINARNFFKEFARMNWDYAEPGCLFWDRIKNYNFLDHEPNFEYGGTNPCVTGDTKILTDNGYIEIKSLVGKKVNIWNGYNWSIVEPKVTAENQKIIKLVFSDGCELKCTPYHKFILADGTRVEAKDLTNNMKLIKHEMPLINGSKELDHAYTQGFFSGDGYIHTSTNKTYIKLYGNKRNIKLDYIGHKLTLENDKCDQYRVCVDVKDKSFVPDASYGLKSRLEWLAGIIDSDGSCTKDGNISISSINHSFLMDIKFMLNTLGINPVLMKMKDERYDYLPDGKGGQKLYHCQSSYRIIISASDVQKLNAIGFETQRVEHDYIPNRNAKRYIHLVSKEDISEIEEKVYCFNEQYNHSGIFNGIITAQCAEEPLPEGGACNLGSINLSEYVYTDFVIDDKEHNRFDFDKFVEDVRTCVFALNDVLIEGLNRHPLQDQKDTVKNLRQIGLGIMGLGDMLTKLGIRYGSPESIALCNTIGYKMIRAAVKASVDYRVDEEEGTWMNEPHMYWDEKRFRDSNFVRNTLDTDTVDYVCKHGGMFNSQLLTCAPTGSLSTMLGISGGIEPFFGFTYTRKTESLHNKPVYYTMFTPIVQEYMDKHNIKTESELPDFFVTAHMIPWEERVDMQSVWQKYIDASISSTVNLPNEATVDDVMELYLYAWKKGLKGITIYRDGCARTPVLSEKPKKDSDSTEEKSEEKDLKRGDVITKHELFGLKRTIQSGCGSLHCAAYFDRNTGEFVELFLGKGSKGGCLSTLNGLARMVSLSARGGVPLEKIIDQLKSANACPSYAVRTAVHKDTSIGSCCPSAIANALIDMTNEMKMYLKSQKEYSISDIKLYKEALPSERVKMEIYGKSDDEKCPECGTPMERTCGCISCPNCGWSKCS